VATAGKFETVAAVTVGELATPAIHVVEAGQFDEEDGAKALPGHIKRVNDPYVPYVCVYFLFLGL
jgi:hypothetical protein